MRRLLGHARALSTVAEASGKHVPFGEAGSGLYSAKTKGCFDVIDNCEALALSALERALDARRVDGTADRTAFGIGDFGTADAGTSMPLLRTLASAVRAAEPRAPIVVHYEDQPMNDWQSVFRLSQGTLPGARSGSGFADSSIGNVYVVASGTSFYNQCFAPNTLDLAFSATAMHWLTELPTALPDALHSACTADTAAAAAFAEQAARDWERIMLMRGRELKAGGQMVVLNFAKDAEGRFLGQSAPRVKQSMHHTFSELWRSVAGEEVHAATNFLNQYRPLEACAAPFEAASSPVRQQGLRLLSGQTAMVHCPFHTEWVEGRAGTDAAAYAKEYVGTTRTWSNSTFVSGATAAGIAPAEADAMVDEMFSRYEARVAAAPPDHAMDYVHSYLHIEKQRSGDT